MLRPVLCAALMAVFFVSPAFGQSCGNFQAAHNNLAEKYGEAPVGEGLTHDGAALRVYANPETGTWTVLTIHPNGVACVRASGEDWQARDYVEPIKGEAL